MGAVVVVLLKTSTDLWGFFYLPMKFLPWYTTTSLFFFLFLYILIIYGTSVVALCWGQASIAPTARTIRNRLLAVSTYLVSELSEC